MNAEPQLQLGRVALRGGVVTMIAQFLKMGIQFVSVAVLARLLFPEDFGLVASVSPVAAFVALLQNLGLQQAVIQRKQISQHELNQIFWLSALVGLGSSVVVVLIAPLVVAFYGDGRMWGILLASAPPLLLGSITAVPLALLNRNLQFGQLAINDVIAAALGLVGSIVSALAGLGYWSLVIGPMVSAIVSLIAAWMATRWMPGGPDFRVHRDIFRFGANLTGFNLANFFSRNLDNILIGKYSGPAELGFYDRAYKLLLFPISNINQPLARLMVPLLSRIQEDKPRFRDIYVRTNWLMTIAVLPGIAAVTITAPQVVAFVFGPHWAPVAPIFAWLGIAGMIQSVSNTTGWIFICQARTDAMFKWGIFSSLTTIASFVIGLYWGAVGVAAAYAITGYAIRTPALVALMHRVGPVTAMDFTQLIGLPIVAALISWGIYALIAPAIAGRADLLVILVVVAINYVVALAIAMIFPQPRRAVMVTLDGLRRHAR